MCVNPTSYVGPIRSASFPTEVNNTLTWFVTVSRAAGVAGRGVVQYAAQEVVGALIRGVIPPPSKEAREAAINRCLTQFGKGLMQRGLPFAKIEEAIHEERCMLETADAMATGELTRSALEKIVNEKA